MAVQRVVVKVDRLHPAVAWTAELTQVVATSLGNAGSWVASIAQKGGSLVAALMGPAVLSVYVFAMWSLTASMGWTDSFPFESGPLSSWLIWLALAACLHFASTLLQKTKERA
jgi:hypothetical protein